MAAGDVIYSVLQGVSSLSQLSSTDQKKITDTVIARLVVGGTATLSESGNMVILNWHYPTQYSAESMVTRFNQGRADILANINWPVPVAHLTGFADATTTFPGDGEQTTPGPGGDTSDGGDTSTVPDQGGDQGGDTSDQGGDTSGQTEIPAGDVIYSVLQGVSSLSQLSSTEQKKITDTVIARLVVGGTATLSESGNMVILNWHYPTQYSAESMVTRFNQGRADILANINWPVPIAGLTGFGDASTTVPTGGGSGDTDGGEGGEGGEGGDGEGGEGGDSGGGDTPSPDCETGGGGGGPGKPQDSGVVYAVLDDISAIKDLSAAEQSKITDTAVARLNIGALGGSAVLSVVNELVVLEIGCPVQIPSNEMVTLFNASKADILANINSPTPIPNLKGLGDAIAKPVSGEVVILPNKPKVRFQLLGVLTLDNLPVDTRESVRQTTSTVTGVSSTLIGIAQVDGGVYVQVVTPDDKDVRQFGDELKLKHDTLVTKLGEVSSNITGIGPFQASASDLGIQQQEAKVSVPVQGLTSLSQITSGVEVAEATLAGLVGVPPENVDIAEKDGGLVVTFTPTATVSATYLAQIVPNANIDFVLNNLCGGNQNIVVGTPAREVESKMVAIKVKDLNTDVTYNLTADTASPLGAFRLQIEAVSQISPGNQILALGGTQVIESPDDTTLGEMGIAGDGFLVGVFDVTYQPPMWGTFDPPGSYKMVGYYAAWGVYSRQFFVTGIDVSRLTHLNYAFANINYNGDCVMGDDWADPKSFDLLKDMKKKNPHLKTLLSVGGWTWSSRFSDIALTQASRAKFARTAAQLMRDHGFDGIDIDWEFPVQGGAGNMVHRAEDVQNYPLLMQAIRNEIGRSKLLTMAVTPNPYYHKYLKLTDLSNICDWINLMAYDYNGPWPGCYKSNFNAPLFRARSDPGDPEFNIHASIESLLEGGLPRHQLVMGLSFYGRGFANVEPGPNGDGLYQPYSGRPFGTWPDEFDQASGVFDYYDLRDNYIGKSDWQHHYSDDAEAAWLYSPSRKVMVGYDDPTTIWAKCSYIVSRGLGGAMIWDHSMDRGNQLLYVASEVLKPDGTEVVMKDAEAVPKNASGSRWDDKNIASGKVSAVHFRIDQNRVYGMKVEYDGGNASGWHGSSTSGKPLVIDIPANIGIKRLVVYTASRIIQAISLVYTNGTSTTVGTLHSRENETFNMRVPFGAIISHFKGKADSSGLTQINCVFKTMPGHDFSRSIHEDRFLRQMVATDNGGQQPLEDYYLAMGKIEVQPEKAQQVASKQRSRSRSAVMAKQTIEPDDGMQFKINAGTGDWLIGYGLRLETGEGEGFVVEYAIRSYLGITAAILGDEDDPAFKFSWNAPVIDMSTGAGVIVKDGGVSITGTILGQGGTLTVDDHGVSFAGTLGPVTFEAGIGDQGVKFFATDPAKLFGGGFEIGPNKLAIGITFFGFSLYLDFGALIRGEISWKDIGVALLRAMVQLAYSFVKLFVTSFVAFFTFGLVQLDL